jgi:pantothenate kinase type III
LPRLFVSVDQGNTRLKLCTWEGSDQQPGEQVGFEGQAAIAEACAWLSTHGKELECGLVSVAGERQQAALIAGLEQVAKVTLLGHGLEIRCESPASVGLDRLFAARGALAYLQRDCIVVDAGTALTVDAVLAEHGGVFLGGAIAPGPGLLSRSLAQGAAQLPVVEPRAGVHALGGDTQAAIRSGVGIGFRGAARELAACMAREAGIEGAPVLVTGGARSFLLLPDSVFGAHTVELGELVHLGLRAAAAGAWSA